MNIKEKIKIICDEKGITFKELDKLSGLPQGSITRWNTNTPSIDKVASVAKILGVSIDYLAGLTESRYLPGNVPPVALKYDSMDVHGREVIDAVFDAELKRIAKEKAMRETAQVKIPKTKRIPLLHDVAAGYGVPADVAWDHYEVDIDNPADFAIKVSGNSMEPYFPDGEIFLGETRFPRLCEIAVVRFNGEHYIKQYIADSNGGMYLFSLNRECKDYEFQKNSDVLVEIVGTIITDLSFAPPLGPPNKEDKPRKKRKH